MGVWISSSGKGPGLELQIQEFCQMLFLPTKSTLHPFPTAFCSWSLTCADAHGSWYPQATLGPVSRNLEGGGDQHACSLGALLLRLLLAAHTPPGGLHPSLNSPLPAWIPVTSPTPVPSHVRGYSYTCPCHLFLC